jgi:hypothetical protein
MEDAPCFVKRFLVPAGNGGLNGSGGDCEATTANPLPGLQFAPASASGAAAGCSELSERSGLPDHYPWVELAEITTELSPASRRQPFGDAQDRLSGHASRC